MMGTLIEEFTVVSPASREELLMRLLQSIAEEKPVKDLIIQPMSDETPPREHLEFTVNLTGHELGMHWFGGILYEGLDKFSINLIVPREGVDEPATVKIIPIGAIE